MKTVAQHVFTVCIIVTCLMHDNEAKRKGRTGSSSNTEVDSGVCELEVTCKGESNLPVKLPIQGPRGERGERGPQGVAGPKGRQGEPGMPADWKAKIFRILGKPLPEATKVAFFAGLKDNVGHIESNENIAFGDVITNVGEAYDPKTGFFTAPSNGTYYFNVVVAAQGRYKAAVELVKNGRMVMTVWAESIPFWGSASSSAILHLQQGDKVWLVRLHRAPMLHGFTYSSFAGYIVFDD